MSHHIILISSLQSIYIYTKEKKIEHPVYNTNESSNIKQPTFIADDNKFTFIH